MKKQIIKYIVFFLLVNITFIGCEEDSNMPYEGLVTEGIPQVSLMLTDNSDTQINTENMSSLLLEFETAIIYEGAASVDLMVVLNGDYEEQGVITSSTTIPSTFQVTADDIIQALPSLTDTNDVVSGDILNFFLNVTDMDGNVYPGYLETGVQTQPASQRSIPGHVYTQEILCVAICPVNIDNLVGIWTGTDTYTESVTCTIEKVDETTIVIRANAGIPIFFQWVWADFWGETFQLGFGNEGDAYFTVNSDGTLISEGAYWGQTLPGPWDYYSYGEGTYFSCNDRLLIDFEMHFDDGDFTDGGDNATRVDITKVK